MTRPQSTSGPRLVLAALAILIGLAALWIMVGSLMSPRAVYFPATPAEADYLHAEAKLATTAAEVGMIRGDLWATAAIAQAAPALFGASPPPAQSDIEKMQALAARAATLSPHDSRMWLLLAGLQSRLGAGNAKIAELLKLSYYTGPDVLSLVPLRLLLAVSSNAIADDELLSLVELDIQHIVAQRPDLKQAIALAYKNALPKGRQIVEATLKKIDPGFLATIRAQ